MGPGGYIGMAVGLLFAIPVTLYMWEGVRFPASTSITWNRRLWFLFLGIATLLFATKMFAFGYSRSAAYSSKWDHVDPSGVEVRTYRIGSGEFVGQRAAGKDDLIDEPTKTGGVLGMIALLTVPPTAVIGFGITFGALFARHIVARGELWGSIKGLCEAMIEASEQRR